jgi:uncharacterized membrane protein YedE/YeeE
MSEATLFTTISFIIGLSYGVIAQRKQFCFSGSIKDIILFSHTRRTASLIVAITTAIFATQAIGYFYSVDFTTTRYYMNINYLFIILGGALFGFGMMISDGCSSRHLIKFAQGEKESFLILTVLGIFSYITYTFFTNNYDTIFNLSLIQSTMADIVWEIPLYLIAPILLFILYKSLIQCRNFFQVLDGVSIGFLVALTWYVTTVFASNYFITLPPQSLSFVYPLGKIGEYIFSGLDISHLHFGVVAVFGIIMGAFISSKFNKQYSKKQMCDNSQQNPPKLPMKLFGGACMGVGGILAIGCTVGQGLSGLSTLSFASLLAITSIYISAYITAKYMAKKNALIACFVFDFEPRKSCKK